VHRCLSGWDTGERHLVLRDLRDTSDADVETAVHGLPGLCASQAEVLWTRHRRPPDLTPRIRQWFEDSGFEEVAFDSPSDSSFAVGTHRLVRTPPPFASGRRLFTLGQ